MQYQMGYPVPTDVEKYVLGEILTMDKDALVAFDILKPEDFFDDRHTKIFEAMRSLHHLGRSIDIVSVDERLKSTTGEIKNGFGVPYLPEIMSEVVSSAGVDDHCKIVKDASIRRGQIKAATQILEKARESEVNNDELSAFAESALASAGANNGPIEPVSAVDCLRSTIDLITKSHSGEIQGLQTQFRQFNHMTGGICKPDVVVLAGRPAVGKTAFALDLADYWATDLQKSGLVFSLEMTKEQLYQRLICRREGIDFQLLRTGRLPRDEQQRIPLAIKKLKESKLFVDDAGDTTPQKILSIAMRHKRKYGLDFVVVDNLSLMRSERKSENRVAEVSEITRSFKNYAKKLDCPIITLVHLNRGIEGRGEDAVPRKSDLRESGSIEQDADVVLAMHRPDPEGTRVNVHILKQRNGPEGVLPLTAQFAHMKFIPYEAAHGFQAAA